MAFHPANEAAHSLAATQRRGFKLEITNWISIKQSDEANLFSLISKLTCHLKGNGAAERTTGHVVRTLWLDLSHLLDVVRCHLLDTDEWFLVSVDAYRL